MKNETPKDKDLIPSSNTFPVVGIGASAGGLKAFKDLLKAIPENSGMAYVLVQHLDPTHESLLPDLLQKVTSIPVREISDEIKVEPDHIYIIPSNKMLQANDGVLQLRPRPAPKKNNMPIDLFFSSLAEVHQMRSIGVVLSGTASDGTLGLKAIKEQGGLTFAQNEASAEYKDMPRNAVQAGVVDFILPPEEIPQKLLEVVHTIIQRGSDEQNISQQDNDVFRAILSLLRIRKGTDFTFYKQTTIRRRILRRMAMNKHKELSGYLKYLRENRPEQDVLYQELLIPVTAFFRDPASFDNLCDTVFPQIIKNKKSTEPLRIWVAGCSTGEEVYSIAICFKETLGDMHEKVQIFATDISEPAIAKARAAVYSKSEVGGLSLQHLQEFFIKTDGSYHVNKQIRDMCVFAVHNFLVDPPFGKMDFISCRNVLIYMEPYLQKKALTTFHYSLNAKGFLLLGKSETVSSVPDFFSSADRKDKLFLRKDGPGRFMQVASPRSEQQIRYVDANPKNENIRTDFQKTADDIILSKYTPAGVIVNEGMDIVHFHGNTAHYLEQSPGKPSHNLLKMAKDGLAFELRSIFHKVKKEKASIIKENIPLHVNGHQRIIEIEAIPLPNIVEPHYLILFHDNKPSTTSHKKTSAGKLKNDEKDLRIQQLERELAQIHEDIRAITEDQEASNEELQSANEELQSGSEELQSLNEELETSKEELQSTNEELTVVNQELIGLNGQITAERDYAQAIVSTIREPLMVLDKNLRVRTANSSFYRTFQVNEQETEGKLIYEVGNKQWDIPQLRILLEKILPQKESLIDFEVKHDFPSIGTRTMLLNARELVRESGTEKLILLALEDVTKMKQVESNQKDQTLALENAVSDRTSELREANESLQQKNQEIALSVYNKRFLTEFSEKFAAYGYHNEFFNSLVQFISDLTKLDYVLIGRYEYTVNEETIQTIALTAFGKLTENISYPLPDGPCEQLIRGTVYSYPDHCRQTFPKNKTLVQLDVEGYIGYPLSDAQGNIIGLIAVMHKKSIEDYENLSTILKIVAKRAEMELERIKFEEQLKQNNASLLQKNQELVRINKELESFAYISSHDLQEPLRKIQTFATRILEKEHAALSDKGKDYFHRMQDSAMRMQTLIQDLLSYSRTTSIERKFEKTDLNKLLKEVERNFKEMIVEKNAVIEAYDLPEAGIIPFQFRQMLYNLIGNSLKFSSPERQPHIVIKGELAEGRKFPKEELTPEKNYCHIRISDNGIGFDPQFKDKIFEVFQRLHGKEEYSGTGIGLSIVKKIVENHSGIITATGKLNKGATFDIYIPAG